MNNIEFFQNRLNNSDKNRYINWSKYREILTNYIIHLIKDDKTIKSLIIGSGNSDDINLTQIEKHTENLVISDIDLQALEKSFRKYKLNNKKSEIKKSDYTGLDDSKYWSNFVKNVITLSTEEEISKYLDNLRWEIKGYKFLNNEAYDLIIVSPIYTQLFLSQSFIYLDILDNLNFPLNLINFIKEEIMKISSLVIQVFNQNIINLMNNNSKLIVISDIFEANYDSDFYKKIDSLNNLDIILKKYQNNYGIGLGDFGLLNLNEILSIKSTKWFEWPFNKQKCFFVKVNEYKK